MTSDAAADQPTQATRQRGRAATDAEPVLPQRSSDEAEVGWGDEPGVRDDDWYRRERPPHHG